MKEHPLVAPKTVFQMPFLLMATMGVHAAIAIWCFLAIVLAPIGMNLMSYQLNGESVQGLDFVRAAGVRLVVGAAISAFVVNALWSEKAWGREAIIGACGLLTVWWFLEAIWAGADLEKALGSMIDPFCFVVFYGWYLYRKRSVRAYYRAIAAQLSKSGDRPNEVVEHGV